MTNDTPPGLLAVRDLAQRYPADQGNIFKYEISRRERDLTLYKSVRSVTHFQLWSAVRNALVTGGIFFLLVLGISEIAKLAQWIQDLQTTKIPVAAPLLKGISLDIGQFVPSSTFINYAARLPAVNWQDAGMLAIALIAILLSIRVVTGWLMWRRSRALVDAMEDIEDELSVLRNWLR